MKGTRRRWLTALLLVGASSVVTLALGELALRTLAPRTLLQPDVPDFAWLAYDPVNGMVNKPGFHARDPRITRSHLSGDLHINNALGFRGDEIAATKLPGATRIVCLGDSSTFGLWLAAGAAWQPDADFRLDNDYPRLLQDELRARGHHGIEVVNAGVVGYNSSHGVRQLVTRILPLAPDVLTVRFGFNDHAFSDPSTYVQDPRHPLLRTLLYGAQDSGLFRLALGAYRRPVGIPAVPVARFAENLRRIVAIARAHDIHLLLVDYPLRALAAGMQPGEVLPFLGGAPSLQELHARHTLYQDALHEVASEAAVPLVVTAADLLAPENAAFSSADLVHPNSRGAELIASRLADALEAEGWVGPAASR